MVHKTYTVFAATLVTTKYLSPKRLQFLILQVLKVIPAACRTIKLFDVPRLILT